MCTLLRISAMGFCLSEYKARINFRCFSSRRTDRPPRLPRAWAAASPAALGRESVSVKLRSASKAWKISFPRRGEIDRFGQTLETNAALLQSGNALKVMERAPPGSERHTTSELHVQRKWIAQEEGGVKGKRKANCPNATPVFESSPFKNCSPSSRQVHN